MQQLLLDPAIIALLSALFVALYIILLYFFDRYKDSSAIEEIFIVTFLIIILGNALVPLSYLNPYSLASGTIKLTSTTFISQLLFFPLFAFLLRSRTPYLYPSVGYLFSNPFLSGLLLITVLSAFWSETPTVTFKASLILLGYAVCASYVAYRYSFQKIGKILRLVGTFTTVSGALAAILIPSIGRMQDSDPELVGAWQGLLDHKNGFAFWMALTAALWFLHAINEPKSRWTSIGLATLSLFVMLPARSGASKVMFLLMSGVLLLSALLERLKRLNFRKATVITTFLGIFLGLLITILLASKEAILNALGKDASLTGRTEFWPQIMQAVWKKPLLGYGYEGFWQSWRGYENPARTIITAGQFVPAHAHNGYLEILIATGFVGVTFFAFALLFIFLRLIVFMLKSREGGSETVVIMLIFLLLSSFSEAKLWIINEHTFLFFLVSTRLNIDTSTKSKAISPIQLASKFS